MGRWMDRPIDMNIIMDETYYAFICNYTIIHRHVWYDTKPWKRNFLRLGISWSIAIHRFWNLETRKLQYPRTGEGSPCQLRCPSSAVELPLSFRSSESSLWRKSQRRRSLERLVTRPAKFVKFQGWDLCRTWPISKARISAGASFTAGGSVSVLYGRSMVLNIALSLSLCHWF